MSLGATSRPPGFPRLNRASSQYRGAGYELKHWYPSAWNGAQHDKAHGASWATGLVDVCNHPSPYAANGMIEASSSTAGKPHFVYDKDRCGYVFSASDTDDVKETSFRVDRSDLMRRPFVDEIGTSAFTVFWRMKRTYSVGGRNSLLMHAKDSSGDNGIGFYVACLKSGHSFGQNNLLSAMGDGTNHHYVYLTNSGDYPTLDVWEDWCLIYDTPNSSGVYCLNGVEVAVNDQGSELSVTDLGSDPGESFYIGSRLVTANNRYWPGDGDDVRIYKGVVPAAVIQEMTRKPWDLWERRRPVATFAPSGSSTFNETGSGGVVIGGSGSVDVENNPPNASEGVVIGGEAILGQTFDETGGGGVVLGGTATVALEANPASSGGAVLGGTVTVSAAHNPASSGEVVIAGEATVQTNAFDETGSGGVVVGGTATIALEANPASSGGVVIGGAAVISGTANETGSGAIVIGGAASVPADVAVAYARQLFGLQGYDENLYGLDSNQRKLFGKL